MGLRDKIYIISLLIIAAFLSGFFYGRGQGKTAALQNAVADYRLRGEENRHAEEMDFISLCVALGGVRRDCAAALRRLGAAAKAP